MLMCKLNTILFERGLRITKVSKDTGISRTTLTALTQNRSLGIQFDTLDTLCTYLNITPSDLFIKETSATQKGILETIKDLCIKAEKEWKSCDGDVDLGKMSAYRRMLRLFEDAQEFDCGLYANYEAVIKGKCSERDTIVELPPNYKLIVVKQEE